MAESQKFTPDELKSIQESYNKSIIINYKNLDRLEFKDYY